MNTRHLSNTPVLGLPKIALLASSLYLGLMGSVLAAQSVDKQLDIGSDVELNIKVQQGQITIKSWDKNTVSVTGTLDELSEGFVFELQGKQLKIEDKMPRQYNGRNSTGSQLTIQVPKTVQLDAETISADIQIDATQGELELNTVSGNITANTLSGETELQTVSGDITAKNLEGKITLDTVSGTIKDTDSQGEVRYRLVSGDLNSLSKAEKITIQQVSGEVDATLPQTVSLRLKSVSGDSKISIDKALSKGDFESVSGNIQLIFASTPAANFDIDGGPSGDISNGLTQDAPTKQKYVPGERLSFQIGSGAASVKMNTISGDLSLSK